MDNKTTIFYNKIEDLDIITTLLFYDDLQLFLDRIITSEGPKNYFKIVSLV